MYKSEPAEICLDSTRLPVSNRQSQISKDSFRQPIPTTQATAVKGRLSVVSRCNYKAPVAP
jgi:hypothetical protein